MLEWTATASSATAASTGCTRNAVGSSAPSQGIACPLDGRPQREVQVRPDKLEVVASFCYLGYMLSEPGGCELSTTTHMKITWKKFKDTSLLRHVAACTALVFHARETWLLTKPNLQHLQRNDRAIIRQICNQVQ